MIIGHTSDLAVCSHGQLSCCFIFAKQGNRYISTIKETSTQNWNHWLLIFVESFLNTVLNFMSEDDTKVYNEFGSIKK